jgi:hypothetical protein
LSIIKDSCSQNGYDSPLIIGNYNIIVLKPDTVDNLNDALEIF